MKCSSYFQEEKKLKDAKYSLENNLTFDKLND